MKQTARISTILGHLDPAPTRGEVGGGLRAQPCAASTQQVGAMGHVGVRAGDDVVVVSAIRTPIGKARRGAFRQTTPDDLLLAVLRGTLAQTNVDPHELGDIQVGNVQLGGSYAGPARMAMFRAGFPDAVPIAAVNRQCSSGLQAVANVACAIRAGVIDAGIGAGVESMSFGGGVAPKPGEPPKIPPMNLNEVMDNKLARDSLIPMGITSETVAERYGITREEQDAMAADSHNKALRAQREGWFDAEIVPVTVTHEDEDGNEKQVVVTKDDGPRPGSTPARLAKLRPAFKPGGCTTAGNASQVSDGAAAVLLMRRDKATRLGLPVLGAFRGFRVVGVAPDEMGVGPAVAIPAVLAQTALRVDMIDAFEINEAFASQAAYCVKKVGIPMEKVNPLGGAIALGHPLGCTGARQVATLMHHLKRTGGKLGVVSMCIGTGMGAAAVFEAE